MEHIDPLKLFNSAAKWETVYYCLFWSWQISVITQTVTCTMNPTSQVTPSLWSSWAGCVKVCVWGCAVGCYTPGWGCQGLGCPLTTHCCTMGCRYRWPRNSLVTVTHNASGCHKRHTLTWFLQWPPGRAVWRWRHSRRAWRKDTYRSVVRRLAEGWIRVMTTCPRSLSRLLYIAVQHTMPVDRQTQRLQYSEHTQPFKDMRIMITNTFFYVLFKY